jgi:formate hydrogenlyase subunit 3/multisubunit Na+/H+ antiporter MnhD subunit
MDVFLLAITLQIACGTAAFFLTRWPRVATVVGAGGTCVGCLLGMIPTVRFLIGSVPDSLQVGWDATHGNFSIAMDSLSAFFLVPVLGLSALAAIFGGYYLFNSLGGRAPRSPWLFFNLFVAGMAMVLVVRTAFLFIVVWEVMSIAAYCLVTIEHEKSEVRHAGWIYLIATHMGVLFLMFTFLVLGRQAGSLDFHVFHSLTVRKSGWTGLVFVLALIGFGMKAGLVPFHVWLPEAHPAAPPFVSALMSGVMIKMGIYGLLRIMTFLGGPEPWWGLTLAGLGLVSCFVGIAMALSQRDIKRVLAYSSIENIGLIALALGLGLWGWASHRHAVGVLATAAALLHIWNHALMKGLLFFTAGSVIHQTGTKDMEQLGGLISRMPWTGSSMLIGAVAIAALPPLNGFVSKFLLYLSLIRCGLTTESIQSLPALLAVGLLALIGSLTALTFVRLTGIILLGSPRSKAAAEANESSPWLLGPIVALVVLCLTAAVFPQAVVNLTLGTLDQVLGASASQSMLGLEATDGPLDRIGNLNRWVLLATVAGIILLVALTAKSWQKRGTTWSCGYRKPTARMQYTGQSFSEMMADNLLPRFLRPRTARTTPSGLFPSSGEFTSESPDPLSQKVYEPFFRFWSERFTQLRILQQGKVHIYLVYIMLMVVLAFTWATLRTWWRVPT